MKGYPRKSTAKRPVVVNERALKLFLATGHDYFHNIGDLADDKDFLRECWQEWRDEIMAERLAVHPGTRPAGWWWYDYTGVKWWEEAGFSVPWRNHQLTFLEDYDLLTLDERRKLAERPPDEGDLIRKRFARRPWLAADDES